MMELSLYMSRTASKSFHQSQACLRVLVSAARDVIGLQLSCSGCGKLLLYLSSNGQASLNCSHLSKL